MCPSQLLPRWECARDWKGNNPKGTQKAFETYWAEVEQDKERIKACAALLDIFLIALILCIRSTKTRSRYARFNMLR